MWLRLPAARRFGRWWCAQRAADASGECGAGCAFELCDAGGATDGSRPPLCHCGRTAAWRRNNWMCTQAGDGGCEFVWKPEPSRPPPLRVASADIERETARSTAALLTAAAYGPLNAWCFVGPANCGAGLFARVALRAQQAIGEYGGPRLPARLHTRGEFVLQIPGTEVLIDAAGENAPWGRTEPDYPAVYANHSARPNARLETWPVLRAANCELRQHMVLVAIEPIAAGAEIRINYDAGTGQYWGSGTHESQPLETESWRKDRRTPPPPPADAAFECFPVIGRLAELRKAVHAENDVEAALTLPMPESLRAHPPPLAWGGRNGGDERLRQLIAMMHEREHTWGLLATHVPGRTGRECRERWIDLQRGAAP